ncbi:MAG: translation elongation factor Ts [Actinomycetia bacterium]|nr:translation elongation factor Ts [Actinomycetes bacterium]
MANVPAADVKRLREATGAGMMDSKKALEEAEGDFDKAIELLRIKGAKSLGKRAERTAANGLVAAADGALIELNCETDFVAKNDSFQQLGAQIASAASITKPVSSEELAAATLPDGQSVQHAIDALATVIGEKLVLGRVAVFEGSSTVYLHKRASDLPPSVGVLVAFNGDDVDAARGAAMQVAAMRPQYLTREDIPADVVENERRIAEATSREEGKPEGALPKIDEGRVTGFYKQVVLLDQVSVQNQKKTVKQVLADAGVTLTQFARFEVGQV